MAPETPKGASSRLLSMKFMQRAAASAGTTPGSGSDAPSSKKRKLGNSDDYDLNINSESIRAAIDERDAKRVAALEQHASNDTHWVLDTKVAKKAGRTEKKPMKVLYVGYGDFGSDDGDEDKTQFGRTSTKKHNKTEDSTSDHSSDEQDEGGATVDGRKRKRDSSASGSRSRSVSRSNSKQTPEADRAKQFRDKRKKKDVKINQITSISNQGSGANSNSTMTCFTCQQKGHKASDCPQKGWNKSKGKR